MQKFVSTNTWWKFGLKDVYTQDPNYIEEWFGPVKIIDTGGWHTIESRPSCHVLKNT